MIASSINTKRAGAQRAFALLFGLGTLSGCATTDDYEPISALDPNADFAFYTASIASMEYVGEPPCPKDAICLDSVFELTAQPIEHIAGNPGIGRETYIVAEHTQFRDGIILLIHAKRNAAGNWNIADLAPVSVQACVDAESSEDTATLSEADSDWYVDQETSRDDVCIGRFYRAPSR
ncbi:MAG: hypothetical protein AAF559_08665 [Pseudomonadota bacterium]